MTSSLHGTARFHLITPLVCLISILFLLTCVVASSALIGDLNHDGKVGTEDLEIFERSWFMKEGQEGFNPECDFTGDGFVDIRDLIILGKNWGKTEGPPPSVGGFVYEYDNDSKDWSLVVFCLFLVVWGVKHAKRPL